MMIGVQGAGVRGQGPDTRHSSLITHHSGLTALVDKHDIIRLTGWSESSVHRFFKKKGVAEHVVKEKVNGWPKYSVPATCLPLAALARWKEERGILGGPRDAGRFINAPEWSQKEALRRERAVQAWRRAKSETAYGDRVEAMAAFVETYDEEVSTSTLARWDKVYGHKCDIDALLPHWGKRDRYGALSDEEQDYILALWADRECPDRTVQVVYDSYCLQRRKLEGPKARCASYTTVRSLCNEPVHTIWKFWAKHGLDETMRRFGPFVTRTRKDAFRALAYVGDHHQFDFPVISQDGKRVIRPWITAFIDYATTLWVGWALNENPNTDTIKVALLRALEWATPWIIHQDNGKDYRSKALAGDAAKKKRGKGKGGRAWRITPDQFEAFAGIYQYLGIETVHALPYNARSKIIERAFQMFTKRFSVGIPGHLGNSTANRNRGGDELMERTKRAIAEGKPLGREHGTALTWVEFTELFNRFIRWCNEERETKAEGVKGETAIAAWTADDHPLRSTDPEALRYTFLTVDERVAGSCRVRLLGADYMHPILGTFEDRAVRLRYHPDDLTRVHVHEPGNDKFICTAERVEGTAAYTGDTAEAIKANKRAQREWKDAVGVEHVKRLAAVRATMGPGAAFGIPDEPGPEIEKPAAAVVNMTPLSAPARDAAAAGISEPLRGVPAFPVANNQKPETNNLLTELHTSVKRPRDTECADVSWADLYQPTNRREP